ncbi:MAG: carbon starvation CstA 5TM domain-containing protein [Candidatus Competibacteraceae bacterium]
MIQDLLGTIYAPWAKPDPSSQRHRHRAVRIDVGLLRLSGHGRSVGSVNTIWPLFGIGNQMLAGIALLLCTTVLIKMKRERYIWVTIVPTGWLLICTLAAPAGEGVCGRATIGFFAIANKYSTAATGTIIAPAKSIADMGESLSATLCGSITILFVALVVAMVFFTVRVSLPSMRNPNPGDSGKRLSG